MMCFCYNYKIKRGMNATIEEWLNSAEYIMNSGNPNVIL